MRQLQTAALEGKLLDRDELAAQRAGPFAALRDRALGIGDRIASRGVNRSADELRRIVDAEIRDLLDAVTVANFEYDRPLETLREVAKAAAPPPDNACCAMAVV